MDQKLIEEALSLISEQFEFEHANPTLDTLEISAIEQILSRRFDIGFAAELLKGGYLAAEEHRFRLTDSGLTRAASIIRRQRLAERLLVDILDRPRTEIDSDACEFEHIISPEVEQSICILLGHPRECPHGSPIPAGACCSRAEETVASVIVPLSRMQAGESGRVAYLLTQEHPELHRLLRFGLVPGRELNLHQTYPAFVIRIGETQLAMEPEVAGRVYLRRTK